MSKMLCSALLLSLLCVSAEAYTLRGKIVLPGEPRPPMLRISLNAGEYWAYSRFDGSFVVDGVAAGTYNLDVLSAAYSFARYKVNVRAGGARVQALEYPYPGAQKQSAPYPLVVRPVGRLAYFVPRQTYGLSQVLKNPMMLMMGFTMLMVFVMPRMMKNMDPEEMEKMQEQMGSSNDPNELWNELWGKKKKEGDDSDDED